MKIELHRIKIRDLVDGYVDDAESGVRGCGGLLDIRPAYQREFVYKGVCPVCGGHFEYEEMEMRPRHRRRVARARSASREAVARGRATTSCRGRRAARPFPKTYRCSAAATMR